MSRVVSSSRTASRRRTGMAGQDIAALTRVTALMGPDVCLIVNPHAGGGGGAQDPPAGGGRAAKRLPAVEAALRGRGIRFRVERTRSLEHACEVARGARDAGEVAAAM